MNHLGLVEHLVALEGHVAILNWFLANEPDDAKVRLEIEGRCDRIESRVAQIRGAVDVGRAKSNVHVLGDRPSPEAA